MNLAEIFSKNLKKYRLQKGISQETLALNAGLDRTYIQSIEKGERNVTLLTLEKISKTLEIPPCSLLKLNK